MLLWRIVLVLLSGLLWGMIHSSSSSSACSVLSVVWVLEFKKMDEKMHGPDFAR